METREEPSLPDVELRMRVLDTLQQDERTVALELRVGVLNGIVHLAGAVATKEVRLLAERMVKAIHGVRGVVNRIDAPGAPSPSRSVNLNLKENKR